MGTFGSGALENADTKLFMLPFLLHFSQAPGTSDSFALLYNPTWDSEIAQGRFGVRHPANWGLGITSSTQTSQDSTVAVSRVGPRTIDGPSLN